MIRLQVFLSHSGLCSRRKAMELVQRGHVKVNGRVVREPSFSVDGKKDRVACDGKTVRGKAFEYILLHKPAGVVTTKSDRFAQKTVLDLLPPQFRHLNPVGRLDKDTEGLLLLTNDGDIAHVLTHPRFDVGKTYYVKMKGLLAPIEKDRLQRGVVIEGKKTSPAQIRNIKRKRDQTWLTMTIHEGRKRQIRLMFDALGHSVIYLKRTHHGPLKLTALRCGHFRRLTPHELKSLKKLKDKVQRKRS